MSRIEKLTLKKEIGDPRVEKTERSSQDKNVKERIVDEIGKAGSEKIRVTDDGCKPFGEGTDIRAKEGVEGVGESVVWAESSVADGRETHTRPHGVHHVRTRAWHDADATTADLFSRPGIKFAGGKERELLLRFRLLEKLSGSWGAKGG